MTEIYTAEAVNAAIQENWQSDLKALKDQGITPTLATLRVGHKGADVSYEKGATKRMRQYGIDVKNVVLDPPPEEKKIIEQIEALNEDPSVHGILLFQPLPEGYHDHQIIQHIDPKKDVEGATDANLADTLSGRLSGFAYCAPEAVMALLDHYHIDVYGKRVVIIGCGLVVGRPLASMLLKKRATVTMCNTGTRNLPEVAKNAEILIAATGRVHMVTEDFVSPGQIVIDVGTTYQDGRLWGDVDFEAVEKVVKAVTPTPGGVSGITSAILAKHVIAAAKDQAKIKGEV
ncbi:MAG: bifunctional 5,10-methylenetetrahydrofolate dehydrogenase/5,10-methenyltetrahydrofolate cyclohydrolase [Pseudoramibacter sp.]